MGVQSKCHCDQCGAEGVAFIFVCGYVDVESLKWVLTAVTPTIGNNIR